jgi:hypothetical protein
VVGNSGLSLSPGSGESVYVQPARKRLLVASWRCEAQHWTSLIDASKLPNHCSAKMTNAGRANLCLAAVDTIIVVDANDLAG